MYGCVGVLVVFFCSLLGTKNRLPRQFVKRSNKIRNEENLATSFETSLRELPGSGL